MKYATSGDKLKQSSKKDHCFLLARLLYYYHLRCVALFNFLFATEQSTPVVYGCKVFQFTPPGRGSLFYSILESNL